MGIFEEEAWDATPEVNKLEDDLFGTVGRKMRKKRKGAKMTGGTEKKRQKTELPKVDTDGEVTTPPKKQRGKRGVRKSKKKKQTEGEATPSIDVVLQESNPRKKKLKIKKMKAVLKANASKGIFPKTQKTKNLLRNKYKYLGDYSKIVLKEKPKMKERNKLKATDIAGEWVKLNNKKHRNQKLDLSSTTGNITGHKMEADTSIAVNEESAVNNDAQISNMNQQKKKLKKKKGVRSEKKIQQMFGIKEHKHQKIQKWTVIENEKSVEVLHNAQIPKIRKDSVEVEQEKDACRVAAGVKEPQKTIENVKKGVVSTMASTPITVNAKTLKTVADLSEGLFTHIKTHGDDSVSEQNTMKKKKKKWKRPASEDSPTVVLEMSTESAKKRQMYKLAKKEKHDGGILQSTEDTTPTKKTKKKKKKLKWPVPEDSPTIVPETSTEPAKQIRINNLATIDDGHVESVQSAEDGTTTKKTKKKKKTHTPDSQTNSTHKHVEESTTPPTKSPFNIIRLKQALEKKPDATRKVSMEKSVVTSPIIKSKQTKPLSLRERMQAHLSGARFRYINEQLYTCTGAEAQQLMRNDPDAFKVYHEGFESQVEKWPQNPVRSVIRFIKARPSMVVADLGCGDAKLAQGVNNKVHSFDLVATNEHVTACDIAKVPLASGAVDVAVFCLALMGTNLVDFICEANRILKKDGILIVAEVVSRFEKVGSFVRKMAKLGFDLTKKDDSNKMFIWFEFTKTAEAPSPDRRPVLELMPCTYKKR